MLPTLAETLVPNTWKIWGFDEHGTGQCLAVVSMPQAQANSLRRALEEQLGKPLVLTRQSTVAIRSDSKES